MSRPLVVLAVALSMACGIPFSRPGDEALRTRFRADRPAFEALRDLLRTSPTLAERGSWTISRDHVAGIGLAPGDAERVGKAFDTLGLQWVTGEAGTAGRIVFVTWAGDIPGPGHHARGFAWAQEPPRGKPTSDGGVAFETYTPLEGEWYLFEELVD